ncbi:MAG: sensor histidine kinase, partial [Eubacteriales bacterium]
HAKQDELYHLSVTLNQMLDKIENLIRQEKQFTSDASHELRTPISVILAQGEYLLDITENDKEKELAQTIVDKAKQVSVLVSRLLLLARIDQNRQKFNKETVDLSVLVDIAVDSMQAFAARKNIRLLTNIEEGLLVNADEALLLSAVTNLIDNGIKYGKQSGCVTVSAVQTKEATEIAVADDGVGIAEEHLDKIWGRFYRVDDVRNDEYGSSGLGLAMVKSIIELHGGEITVKSKPGQGTEFRIVLK